MSIQKLKESHMNMVTLMLEGLSDIEIGDATGYTPVQVRNVKNSPIFQHELAVRREELDKGTITKIQDNLSDASKILADNASRAAETQVDLLDSENEAIQQRAAQDILDRAGFPKVTKVQESSVRISAQLTMKQLQEIQRLKKVCNIQ